VTSYISRVAPSLASEIPKWLDTFKFDRFLTLATNDSAWQLKGPHLTMDRLTDILREWDARINRKVVGPQWLSQPEDRIWAFYFLEKPQSNPHWHALVRFHPPHPGYELTMMERFDNHAEPIWKKLVPAGSVQSLPIFKQTGVTKYIAKSLPYLVSYEHYVTPDQF
jgi:hypothetical protein